MAKSKSQGIKSRNNREVGVRTGRGARAINHAGVAQLGIRQGNHVTEQGATGYGGVQLHSRGPGYNPVRYGNEVALNVGGGGPGKGYNVIGKSGQQGTHGTPEKGNPMPRPKAILPGWSK